MEESYNKTKIYKKKEMLQILKWHPNFDYLKKKGKRYLSNFINVKELIQMDSIEKYEDDKNIKERLFRIFIPSEYHPNQSQYHNS